MDTSPELGSRQLNYYQGLIGILRWACEIRRIDILMPVSLLSRYLVSARQGHLEQVFHIFAYLKHHPRSTMVFDDTIPVFRGEKFVNCDWSEFYPEACEAIPEIMPEPRGNEVVICGRRSCRMSQNEKVPLRDSYLCESRPNHMVLETTKYCRSINLWFRVIGHEVSDRDD